MLRPQGLKPPLQRCCNVVEHVARLVRVSCWMEGLVFDHEWALIHTNEEDLFRENSCSFVVLKIESQDSTQMAANALRSRKWPRIW